MSPGTNDSSSSLTVWDADSGECTTLFQKSIAALDECVIELGVSSLVVDQLSTTSYELTFIGIWTKMSSTLKDLLARFSEAQIQDRGRVREIKSRVDVVSSFCLVSEVMA